MRPWISRRNERECFHQLVAELELEDEAAYFNYFRMDKQRFGFLVDLVESRIRKCDTTMRQSIKPSERLAVTLRYLATGESFKSLEFQFRISRTTISDIVVETCLAIFDLLSPGLKNTIHYRELAASGEFVRETVELSKWHWGC